MFPYFCVQMYITMTLRKMKNIKRIFITITLLQILLGFFSCSENPTEQKLEPCPPIDNVSKAPYNSPVWHPSGKFIGFNYTKYWEVYTEIKL